MRPRIGITSWHQMWGEQRWQSLPEDYTRAIAFAGGLPLILPILRRDEGLILIEEFLDGVDGLLFTGGEDIHPAFYGEPILDRCGTIDQERDHFEMELAKAALARHVPILGICRGMQLLNIALGGSLYQDLHYCPGAAVYHCAPKEKRYALMHKVTLFPGSRLATIFGTSTFAVTSTHHQLVKDVARGLKVTAVAEDGVVEGVEAEAYPFLLAVQWHPERMIREHEEQLGPFRALVQAASRRR